MENIWRKRGGSFFDAKKTAEQTKQDVNRKIVHDCLRDMSKGLHQFSRDMINSLDEKGKKK